MACWWSGVSLMFALMAETNESNLDRADFKKRGENVFLTYPHLFSLLLPLSGSDNDKIGLCSKNFSLADHCKWENCYMQSPKDVAQVFTLSKQKQNNWEQLAEKNLQKLLDPKSSKSSHVFVTASIEVQ